MRSSASPKIMQPDQDRAGVDCTARHTNGETEVLRIPLALPFAAQSSAEHTDTDPEAALLRFPEAQRNPSCLHFFCGPDSPRDRCAAQGMFVSESLSARRKTRWAQLYARHTQRRAKTEVLQKFSCCAVACCTISQWDTLTLTLEAAPLPNFQQPSAPEFFFFLSGFLCGNGARH
jgi:hypothetical protein